LDIGYWIHPTTFRYRDQTGYELPHPTSNIQHPRSD
jgi:hypothetical protein